MIWNSNLDLQVNPGVCQIAPNMLLIHYVVGISHFAGCHENRLVPV